MGREFGDAVGSPEEGDRAVGVLVQPHGRPDEVRPERARRDLQAPAAPAHGVVVADLPGLVPAENVAPGRGRAGDEGRPRLGGRDGEAGVVRRQVALGDEAVGGLDRGDAGQRQLLDQPVLQGAEGALERPRASGA